MFLVRTIDPGFFQVVRHFFFAVAIQAGFHDGVGVLGMHPVRSRHDHRMQPQFLGVRQHLLVVLIGLHVVLVGLQVALAVTAVVFPDIANRFEAEVWDIFSRVDQDAPLGADADDADVDHVGRAGFENCRGRQFGGRRRGRRRLGEGHLAQHQSRAGGGNRLDKITPGDVPGFHLSLLFFHGSTILLIGPLGAPLNQTYTHSIDYDTFLEKKFV